MNDWRPSAKIETLAQRAKILAEIRSFLHAREVLEVQTPVLGSQGVTDPNIHAFQLLNWYLQTSPEYFLKRLLAAGSGDVYQMGPVFRRDEQGGLHHHEFTLLEWYRLNFNDRQLAQEVIELIQALRGSSERLAVIEMSYAEALASLGIDLFSESIEIYQAYLEQRGHSVGGDFDLVGWRELVFSECLQQDFPSAQLTVIYDYPADSAALARLTKSDSRTAARFEVFWGATELANGYHELRDPHLQQTRFESDIRKRKSDGLTTVPIDQNFLAALESGLPDCAGVALGVDRLVMQLLGKRNIAEVLAFLE